MVSFCAAIRIDSVSLLSFPHFSHVHDFPHGISSVYRLKYPYSYLASNFRFLVVVLLVIMLSVLFLVAVISLSLLILCYL